MTDNISTRSREESRVSVLVNPRMHITPTLENPCGYPPFNMYSICGFTNNQIIYYLITSAIPLEDQPQFQKVIEHRKKVLQIVNWSGVSDRRYRNNDANTVDTELDSNNSAYLVPVLSRRGIKFTPSNIIKLYYNSIVAQYENWVFDLKRAFRGDPAKFSTSSKKIILVSMTFDKQLKTTYNSNTRDSLVLIFY
jgi:hypothetical protein